MSFRLALRRDPGHINELSEQVGNVLNGVTFILFGAILLGPALGELTWQLALYAVLSLTLVRMLPVAIAMMGTRAKAPTLGFLGWFGPRGLASIVFAVIVIEESNLPHEHLIVLAIYLTVGLSVFAHGITAAPLAGRYARWYERHPRERRPGDGGGTDGGVASPRTGRLRRRRAAGPRCGEALNAPSRVRGFPGCRGRSRTAAPSRRGAGKGAGRGRRGLLA